MEHHDAESTAMFWRNCRQMIWRENFVYFQQKSQNGFTVIYVFQSTTLVNMDAVILRQ